MPVSFDCFGTLVDVSRPADPAAAVAAALADRGVATPEDWATVYATDHLSLPPARESPLDRHVRAALASRDVAAPPGVVRDAVRAAFDRPVQVREGARSALALAADRGPVGVCSNCAVPGLVDRVLDRADLPAVDATVTSVDLGYRKPDRRAFAAVARALDAQVPSLVHVGDDARVDGAVADYGGRYVPAATLPDALEGPR
ncbi:MAG: HAD family hydrolase [Halobacteriaceae archaeon]